MMSDDMLLVELETRLSDYKRMLKEQKELSSELIQANKKLTESEALRSHFISSITNEIINPFASVLGLSDNLLRMKEGDWGKVKHIARLIYSEAFSLDFQLRNIFVAANIEAGNLSVDPSQVSIDELISGVMEAFRNEAHKKNITVTSNLSKDRDHFITDNDKVRLIISNLLSNAIKFNRSNGTVHIKTVLLDGFLKFSIDDSGPGISSEKRLDIFDRFTRINGEINSVNTGHGLGLPIVKSLVELLNGSIDFGNSELSGSSFVFVIPEIPDNDTIFKESDDLNSTGVNEIF